jgi:PAS domain S-box-containing protein
MRSVVARPESGTRSWTLAIGVIYGLIAVGGYSDQEVSAVGLGAEAFADSRFGSQAVMRLRAAFEQSQHPMLLADDQRRWVSGNAAAGDLLGLSREEIPWHTMDECTPEGEHARLADQWSKFLAGGQAEGWYQLYLPNRGCVPVEFSATANVLPSRHLAVFIPPDSAPLDGLASQASRDAMWSVLTTDGRGVDSAGRLELTEREREVMALVASGLQSGDIAGRLFLSPETVKTHVHNAMGKLGVHTRAHAVAVALVSGQIAWEIDASSSPAAATQRSPHDKPPF